MLPIEPLLPDLVAALRQGDNVVLEAPTGAGKTTLVPPALLDADFGPGRILLLEPRRLAARAAAQRMAELRGQEVGQEVGYQVRFERCFSRQTRILAVTEGILLRMLSDDPFLEDVALVLFDEFHERRLDSDVALGMIRALQQSVRPQLRTVVMSATLPADSLTEYLRPSRLLRSEGRLFPVEVQYAPPDPREPVEAAACRAVRRQLAADGGDVLVFLPGVGEIRRLQRQLEAECRQAEVELVELYGDLPLERQRAALCRGPRRRVVLATNVAETSVTVEGVTAVIDSGLERQLQYDPRLGLDRLQVIPISRASARQRAGRAGRLAPGTCLRLWSEASELTRPDHHPPEIRRLDLSHALLHILCWLDSDESAFPWYDAPRPDSLAQARRLLQRLEALDERGVTALGRSLARLPVSPRLGRLLWDGQRLGVGERAALAAALLSERDPFLRSETRPAARATRSDLLDRVECLEQFERQGQTHSALGELSRSAARSVLRVREQLLRSARTAWSDQASTPSQPGIDPDDGLLRSLLAAFPDRLARRRGPGDRRALMENGRGVKLAPHSAVHEPELFLCLDVDASQSEAFVRCASEVRREWLAESRLQNQVEVEYDAEADRVVARRRVSWGELQLEEHPAALPDSAQVAAVLAAAADRAFEAVVPSGESEAGELLTRLRCARIWLPEAAWPDWDEQALRAALPEVAQGCRSFRELRERGWLDYLRRSLSYEQQQALDREAPPRWTAPNGHRLKLSYEVGRPPVLAVRIQELLGLAETPRVARRRVAVLLHLLAPNFRPVQVTDDLASFWHNIYPKVRQELRRRYPKHAWPEDPLAPPPPRK